MSDTPIQELVDASLAVLAELEGDNGRVPAGFTTRLHTALYVLTAEAPRSDMGRMIDVLAKHNVTDRNLIRDLYAAVDAMQYDAHRIGQANVARLHALNPAGISATALGEVTVNLQAEVERLRAEAKEHDKVVAQAVEERESALSERNFARQDEEQWRKAAVTTVKVLKQIEYCATELVICPRCRDNARTITSAWDEECATVGEAGICGVHPPGTVGCVSSPPLAGRKDSMSDLRKDIESTLNRHSAENGSNTPDFILADYLLACLKAYDAAVQARAKWYGRIDAPGQSTLAPEPPAT